MPVEPRSVPVASVPPAPSAATPAETEVPAVRPARPDEAAPDVEALGDRIADLAARIQAATYELLVLIRQFDERGGWEGFASCAHWLSWRIGLAPGAAREKVRVAHALADLPRLSEALRRGAVSYSKVRAVTRVATPATEQALLDVALAGTAAHVEQVVRTWRRVDRAAEQAEDRRRHESRALHTWADDDGTIVVRGRLTPEVGAVLRRALEAALDARRGAAEPAAGVDGEPHAATPDATAGGTVGAEAAGGETGDEMAPTIAQRRADALGMVAECALAGGLDKGTAGDRYQVVVHVDADTLADGGEEEEERVAGRRLGDGAVVDGAAVDRAAASRPDVSPAVGGATAGRGPETPAPDVPDWHGLLPVLRCSIPEHLDESGRTRRRPTWRVRQSRWISQRTCSRWPWRTRAGRSWNGSGMAELRFGGLWRPARRAGS